MLYPQGAGKEEGVRDSRCRAGEPILLLPKNSTLLLFGFGTLAAMDEINRMFEAVHTSKWLPQVEEHTFPSKLMELTLPEEEAILSTTMYKRGCGSKPEEAAAATVAGVAARLDAIIASFGAAFVKLGDCAPKVRFRSPSR